MRSSLVLFALGLLTVLHEASAMAGGAGREWELRSGRPKSNTYELELRQVSGGSISSNSRTVAASSIQGLGDHGLDTDAPSVSLRVLRDAGTVVLNGSIRDGRGHGTFDLELSKAYADELERRGVGRPTELQHRHLLLAGVPLVFLDALQSSGYPMLDVELLVRCADHGVDTEFVQGLASSGYRLGDIDDLIRCRDHGVDPEYIQLLAKAGFRQLPVEELLRARDHGVDEDHIAAMKAAGFGELDLDDLVRSRDHGVDGPFVKGLEEAGYGGLSLDEAIRARDHGVDGHYAKRAQHRAGRTLSLDEVIHMRDSGH
jgi:hypothetical protein